MKNKPKQFLYLFSIMVLFAFAIVTLHTLRRIFIFDQFVVPTSSMEPTLIPGDRIWANKLIFGARIYKSYDFSKEAPLVSSRLKGFRKIYPNDVVVFNHPYGKKNRQIGFRINYVYAKRCIGTPGDTVGVHNGFYYNNRYVGIIGNESRQDAFSKVPEEAISRKVLKPGWLRNIDTLWTIKNMGPLYVPQKGSEIVMNEYNYRIYASILDYETQQKSCLRDGLVWLGDTIIEKYLFKNNYYYFCGDNIANSNDSRNWGFVPEDFIIGVADRISYSKDRNTGRFIKNRFMKRINLKKNGRAKQQFTHCSFFNCIQKGK
jgi:signal peptidase I